MNDPTGVGKGFAPSVSAANAALGTGKVRQDVHPSGTKGTTYSLNEMGKFIREGRNDPRMRAWGGQCIARAEAQKLAKHVEWDAWIESDKLPAGGYTARAKTKTKELASATGETLTQAWQELAVRLRGMSGLTANYGKIKSNSDQAQAILDEIRRVTYYVQDPVNTELMAKPAVTLCLDEHGLCMPSADCDDRCIAFASATMALGIETKIVGQAYNTTQATHVICAILDPGKGGWQKVDPSSEKYNVGDAYPATKEWWMDPISGSISQSATGAKMSLGEEPENGDFIGVGAVPVEGVGAGPESQPDGTECGDEDLEEEIVGVGVFPMAHAFAPGADSASYVPVGMERGLPQTTENIPDSDLRSNSFFGAAPVSKTTSFRMPDFYWDSSGGYWVSSSASKPTMNPLGQLGEWLQVAPYGRRLSAPPAEMLTTSDSWRWVWYPAPANIAQWLNSSIWAVHSGTGPSVPPTPALSYPGAPNTWVTTAWNYWILIYSAPGGDVHA